MTQDQQDRQSEIAAEISYRRTVEAVTGIHESGMRITEYRDIVVRPSDNPGYIADEQDLTNPETRTWWETWCRAEGEFRALIATHLPDELDAVAQRADYADWAHVTERLDAAADDDGIVSIQEEVVGAAVRR